MSGTPPIDHNEEFEQLTTTTTTITTNTTSRKEPSPEKTLPDIPEDTSSREMCAYCDTPITVSSKFYNITCVGDHEYIGRRLNQLGPKKNTYCDRVCKRHYDLNLKRDKAQRQSNAKRERLPGIQFIFDPNSTAPKKQRNERPSLLTELNQPVLTTKWFHTTPPPLNMDNSFRPPPVYSTNPSRTTFPSVWDTNRTNERVENPIKYESVQSNNIKEKPSQVQESRSVLLDLVTYHMNNLLTLFSQNNAENSSAIESIKFNSQHRNINEVIDALCGYTYRSISKIRKEELEKKNSDTEIQDAVRDLITILLKRDNREIPLQKEHINSLFIDWVNLQKQEKGNT